MSVRRFPPPWTAVENEETFQVNDATGYPICYLYFSEDIGQQHRQQRLSYDNARRIAANIAKLPELVKR